MLTELLGTFLLLQHIHVVDTLKAVPLVKRGFHSSAVSVPVHPQEEDDSFGPPTLVESPPLLDSEEEEDDSFGPATLVQSPPLPNPEAEHVSTTTTKDNGSPQKPQKTNTWTDTAVQSIRRVRAAWNMRDGRSAVDDHDDDSGEQHGGCNSDCLSNEVAYIGGGCCAGACGDTYAHCYDCPPSDQDPLNYGGPSCFREGACIADEEFGPNEGGVNCSNGTSRINYTSITTVRHNHFSSLNQHVLLDYVF